MKIGAGTLELAGLNSYTGPTVINAGTLTLSGTNTGNGAFTVNSGATLTLSGAYTGGGALTVNAGATLSGISSGANTIGNFAVTGASSSATLNSGIYNVTSTVGGGNTNTFIDNGGSLTVNGATLNIAGSAAWFPIGNTANTTSTVTLNSGTINVANGFGAEVGRIGNGILTINGGTFIVNDINSVGLVIGDQATAQSGTVNLNGGTLATRKLSTNLGGGTSYAFNFNGGTLQATTTNSGTTFWASDAKVTANVRNNGGIIDNNGTNITIGHALVHSTIGGDNATDGGLAFMGSGTTTLSAVNTYTGATNVNAGSLNVTGVLNAGSSVTVANGSTLLGSGTIGGSVVVGGALAGSLTLNGDATISTGATAQAAAFSGNIVANGTITSAVNLQSGKVLSGSGTVGAVTVSTSGTIAPGTTSTTAILTGNGNMTLGSIGNVAHLSMKLGSTTAGTGYDQISILGNSTLTLTNVNLDGSLLNGYQPTNFATWDGSGNMLTSGDTFYLVIGAGNSLAGKHFANAVNGGDTFTNGLDSIMIGNQEFAISYTANHSNSTLTGGNDIALVAVPEPSTWAMMISGLGLLSFWQRSRRKVM